VHILKHAFFIIFLLLIATSAFSQTEELLNKPLLQDSISNINADTSKVVNKAKQAAKKGDISTTIKYTAKDSIFFNLANQAVSMYGEGDIDYGEIKLEADDIEIDWKSSTLSAQGKVGEDGKKTGTPIFQDGADKYYTEKIKYNFKSKKAYITGVVTQHGEGFIHGDQVKRNEKEEMFLNHAKYTTCNLAEPHFHIEASKLKMIPNDKIITGPFNLRVNNIPTPLGFAFGMFPSPRKRTSGIIFPSYGEERLRGFFLRDGGFYFDVNEYVNLAVQGDIFSRGSHGLRVSSDYRKRYSYNGRFNVDYSQVPGSTNLEDSSKVKTFWVRWNHTPQSKGTSRFAASVNLGTSKYNQYNFVNVQQNMNTTFNSSVNYSKTFTGTPFNMNASMRHNQNVQTGQMDINLPDLALNMNRIYPFKFGSSSGKRWYEKINMAYNFNTTNQLSNRITQFRINDEGLRRDTTYYADFNLQNLPLILDRAQLGGRHTIPISTSMTLMKYFTVNPGFNYEELWYLKSLNHSFDSEKGALRTDTINGFSRAYSYNASASVNTRIYGTFYPKSKKILGVRHVMTPSMGFSYRPDFAQEKYGYYQNVQVDTLGNRRLLSRYDGFVYGTPGMGQSASLNFSINNNIEMKVRTKSDSTSSNKDTKKISIFDNISVSGGYNFLADSLNLSPLRMSARTRLFNNKIDINIGGTLDPYVYVIEGYRTNGSIIQRQVNQYAWDNGKGIGQLSNANLAVGTSFNPKARTGDKKTASKGAASDDEMEFINANPDLYIDWNVPWNLRLNYNLNYNKRGFSEAQVTQGITFSGDLSITEKWKIAFNSGFDIQRKEFTQTNVSINRDLHCWDMRFNWVPFGRFTSYSIDIAVKASVLQDLKLSRRRNFFDRGF
jgi:hypothetical protein